MDPNSRTSPELYQVGALVTIEISEKKKMNKRYRERKKWEGKKLQCTMIALMKKKTWRTRSDEQSVKRKEGGIKKTRKHIKERKITTTQGINERKRNK